MLRSAWVAFVLVALGLWASLLPQVTYPSASSGEPDGDVLVAWPGWSVQQDLGTFNGPVGSLRIWVSADPTAFKDVTLNASLIDAATREVVRQALVTVSRSYIPAAHTVTFPSYVAPEDQRLMLQLGVAETQKRHVVYRLANPDRDRSSIMLNGVPDAGNGPLAFAQIRTGSGLRAAIDGELSSRVILAVAVVSGTLASLTHPRVARRLRETGTGAWRQVGRLLVSARPVVKTDAGRPTGDPPSRFHRVLEPPWYPWPAAAVPILHYLASNPLHFDVSESIIPLVVVLAAVTIGVVGLRFGLKDWHRSAAASTALIVVFFGYGHMAGAIDARLDDRVMFGVAVVLAASVAVLIVRLGATAVRIAPFLNLMAAVLLVFPIGSLVTEAATARPQTTSHRSAGVEDLAAHLLSSGLPNVSGKRPDIYYIILDKYARHDALLDLYSFDNADFIRALEQRGFHVAIEATSNYDRSIHSIPSGLNMAYLDGLGTRSPASRDDLIDVSRSHALGAILRALGYKYVHLDSGFISTDASPLADRIVSFTPSGTRVRSENDNQSVSVGDSSLFRPSSRFIRGLVKTTALAPILRQRILFGESPPYEWHSSHRALRMFEFLSNRMETDYPRFVFAHIIKPHLPATFDQHGNIDGDPGFDDSHDPSVPNAYIGQLIYINKLVLNMIDSILQPDAEPPIIVIAADHGYSDDRHHEYWLRAKHAHSILNAVYLPYGGSTGLYPSISIVNTFRYILDYYFDLQLGLIDDRSFELESDHYDFRKP